MRSLSLRWHVSVAAVVVALAGCSAMPTAPVLSTSAAPGTALSGAETAARVTVHGPQGVASSTAEAATLGAVRSEGRAALVTHHLGVLAAQGEVDLYRGNAARLLVDGPATFGAMKAAIARAKGRVMLESYIVEDAGVAAEFADLLLRKASQGLSVALLYDAVGSLASEAAFFDRLAAGGVAVCKFNPINPLERPGAWGINHRDHRKLLVVDDEVAFTGGINISQVYSSGSSGRNRARSVDALKEGWRDTQIELRGPVVAALARTFTATWVEQGCPGTLAPVRALPASAGQRVVQVLASDPRDASNRIYTTMLAAVRASRVSVHLTMAYFAPGDDMVQALCDAALRGVDVRLVLPGTSDAVLVLHAGRSYYRKMLDAGVRLYEMEHANLHAKTAVIDGVLATVGSSNMDWRSFVANSEINVVVLGDDFGQQVETLFERDAAASKPIDAQTWEQRPLRQRLLERVGRAVEGLL
ncbi:MAG TPA: phospholipase D-like domain-containing protein [Rubrivivax sp.]